MEHFKSKKKSFPSRVISLLVVLAIILTSLNVMYILDQAEAASKKTVAVQSGEKKKIEKFLDKNISEYLNQCCASLVNGDELKMNSLYFKFDKKRKTDMAIQALNPYSSFESVQVTYEDTLWQKHRPYGGLWTYSTKTKNQIKRTGKKLFGDSFELSFAQNNPDVYANDHFFYFFPISRDKKYIVDNYTDWGDWEVEHEYLSVKKKNATYLVKAKYIYGYWDEPMRDLYSNIFTIKLKKKGSSYISTDIKCS